MKSSPRGGRMSWSCGRQEFSACRCSARRRGATRADSDIDLLAAFDDARALSLLDVIGIENQLADLLGQAVDLVEEGTLRPRARQSVRREAVRAF
jgi:predicted nucleotidyltransferase